MLLVIDEGKYFFELGLLKMHGYINEDLTLTELGIAQKEIIKGMFPHKATEECNELRIS